MTELRRARESGRRQDKFRGQKNITHRKTVDYTRGTKESPTIPRIPEMETYSCVSAGIITANCATESEYRVSIGKNNTMYKKIYISAMIPVKEQRRVTSGILHIGLEDFHSYHQRGSHFRNATASRAAPAEGGEAVDCCGHSPEFFFRVPLGATERRKSRRRRSRWVLGMRSEHPKSIAFLIPKFYCLSGRYHAKKIPVVIALNLANY
jgi:hypothetical protein